MWFRGIGLIMTLILSLLAVPLATDAQQPAKVARIGYLAMTGGAGSPRAEALRQGLRDLPRRASLSGSRRWLPSWSSSRWTSSSQQGPRWPRS